jgi:hypothetical protein
VNGPQLRRPHAMLYHVTRHAAYQQLAPRDYAVLSLGELEDDLIGPDPGRRDFRVAGL